MNLHEHFGFEPMLCDSYDNDTIGTNHIIEPKLDGVRCTAFVDIKGGGKVTLVTRQGHQILSCNHICDAITDLLHNGRVIFDLHSMAIDGELWHPTLSFDEISGLVRRKDVQSPKIQFHAFDMVWRDDNLFWLKGISLHNRRRSLNSFIENSNDDSCIKTVPQIHKLNCADDYLHWAVLNGYEGVVIKDTTAHYKFGRARSMLKYKPLHSTEFKIVSFKEGTGEMQGMVGALGIVPEPTKQYSITNTVHMVGTGLDRETRKAIWDSPHLYLGRTIEVTFQSVTNDGNLRFPAFHRFISPPHTP